MTPRPDWQLRPHGTAAAARRHYRRGTPLCEPCRQFEARRYRNGPGHVFAVHAPAVDGSPRCGARPAVGDPLVAWPDEEITCLRCQAFTGRTAA